MQNPFWQFAQVTVTGLGEAGRDPEMSPLKAGMSAAESGAPGNLTIHDSNTNNNVISKKES